MNKDFILSTKLTEEQIAIFYFGQEGVLIKYKNKYILIDAYLSDYVDQNCCTESVKWIRRYPAPIQAENLDFIDYVFCTHDHYDHMDPLTLGTLAAHNPNAVFFAPEPVKNKLLHYGVAPERIRGAVADQLIKLNGCDVIPVPSAHEELHQDENGNYYELGYKIIINNISLYHAGDCCIYNGLCDRIKDVDIMMVPVNGRDYYKLENDIIGNMNALEAILLARKANAGLLIPMHIDLYDINRINPADFVDTLYTHNPRQAFHMFVPGERYIFEK